MLFLLQVDCTANSNTCNKYGVSGYPTLKIFRDGEEAGTYDGPRTAGKSSLASVWLAEMVLDPRVTDLMLCALRVTEKVPTYTRCPCPFQSSSCQQSPGG